MKWIRKKKLWAAAAVAGIYLFLLLLLVRAEAGAKAANIRSFSQALWYSLTTLTTVGYGDLYPVTAGGRLIGAFFQLLGVGLLAFIIGMAFSAMKNRMMPVLRAVIFRNRNCYIFTAKNARSEALAAALRRDEPDCLLFFADRELAPEMLLPFRPANKETGVFCIGKNPVENERQASFLRNHFSGSALQEENKAGKHGDEPGLRFYCLTEHEPEQLPENATTFNPAELCARLYWNAYPVLDPDEEIILIGSGASAEFLLEEALLRNVLDTEQHIRYHVFGSFDNFRRNHPRLREVCSLEEGMPGRDSVLFRPDMWNADAKLLARADRIVVCTESEERTVAILNQMLRYFPIRGRIYACLSSPFERVTAFGSPEEIFTPELVMRTRLNRTAMELHEIYRQESGREIPEWNLLGSFMRRSNLASADHLMTKIRILLGKNVSSALTPELCRQAWQAFSTADEGARQSFRRIEHERWRRFHYLNGWQYGEKRDDIARTHPLLRPFDELPEEEQKKNDYAWFLIRNLAEGQTPDVMNTAG